MSVFYDEASLVLVPSGYKASKVYAQKPLTNDGQLTFSRASTATRVNASGVIETVASNVPRLDYLGSTCPKLLLEPQRTNLVTYSEQFDTASWGASAGGFVRTANATIAPDGTMSADRIQFPAVDTFLIQNTSLTPTTVCTGSVYVKGTAGQTFSISPGGIDRTPFTLNGEWQRITYTATAATNFILIGPINGSNATDVFLWGAQLEAGAYATSYIPTTTAAVTRLADACNKTGISSLIGQTEGTFFAELTFQSDAIPIFIGSSVSGSAGEATYVEFGGSSLYVLVYKGGVLQASMSASGFTNGQNFKLAVGYKLNNFALYVDGTQRATDTSGDVSTSLTNLTLHTYPLIPSTFQYNGKYSQFLLFKTRLTNAQLAEITQL
jgi:spore maturation protein SpmB